MRDSHTQGTETINHTDMETKELLRTLGGLKDRQDVMRNIERYVELSMILRKEREATDCKERFAWMKKAWRFVSEETVQGVSFLNLVHMFNQTRAKA